MPGEAKTIERPKAVIASKDWTTNIEPIFAAIRHPRGWRSRGMSKLSHDIVQFMLTRMIENSAIWEKLQLP